MDSNKIYNSGDSIPVIRDAFYQVLTEIFPEDYFQVLSLGTSNVKANLSVLQQRQLVLQLSMNTKEITLKHCDSIKDKRIAQLVKYIKLCNRNLWFSRSIVYRQEREVEAFQIANLQCIGIMKGVSND